MSPESVGYTRRVKAAPWYRRKLGNWGRLVAVLCLCSLVLTYLVPRNVLFLVPAVAAWLLAGTVLFFAFRNAER